ncbi:MAG: CHC2 zinc finger domain-containing protein, partial [Pseudomonadota bacterium]
MAGRIPQTFIDDLLDRTDIVDVIDRRVKLKKTGKNYSARCPFHDEKTPSFSVNPEKQFYYCFGCGAGGNAIGFVMDYENIDFPQAVENLAGAL